MYTLIEEISKYLSMNLQQDEIVVEEKGLVTRPNSSNTYQMLRVKVSIGRWFWQENSYPINVDMEKIDKLIRKICDSIISNYLDSLQMQDL
jgi:hypothetical protein